MTRLVIPAAISVPVADMSGVYFLFCGDRLVYIGKSKGVFKRVSSHASDDMKDFDHAEYVPVPEDLLDVAEGSFIWALDPPLNIDVPICEDTHVRDDRGSCFEWCPACIYPGPKKTPTSRPYRAARIGRKLGKAFRGPTVIERRDRSSRGWVFGLKNAAMHVGDASVSRGWQGIPGFPRPRKFAGVAGYAWEAAELDAWADRKDAG